MHTSIAASLLASCIDCVCETRPSSIWSVSLLLSAVAADDENEAIFLPQAKMAINSVLPAPKIFRNDYSKLQSHGTEYKCILSKSDAVTEEIAAAKIDTQTPCRYQVYRPCHGTSQDLHGPACDRLGSEIIELACLSRLKGGLRSD